MSDKLPFIQIAQSANCVPPAENLSISLDIKILPDRGTVGNPFFGVWLLDNSGSMDGDRIEKAKQSLIKQVQELPNGTGFNLVTFESNVKDIIKNETISDKSRSKIVKYIDKIEAEGGTALFNALKHGIKIVRGYKGNLPKKIILITDGEPGDVPVELGNENDPNYKKYFLLAREALEYKASIDTVGALGDHNVFLLYEIAKASTGKYIFAENAQELKTKMLIASEQTTRIMYAQPSITITCLVGKIKIDDAVQYKPTIIRMPFEKIKNTHKAFLRSFEAGDTYQILMKLNIQTDPKKIQREGDNHVVDILFDFGKKNLLTNREVIVKFSEVQANHRINPQINKQYANLFTAAEEITEQTIKNDASATQRIQGDETKKISN
jgi:Ca-activated chloride channel homolog